MTEYRDAPKNEKTGLHVADFDCWYGAASTA